MKIKISFVICKTLYHKSSFYGSLIRNNYKVLKFDMDNSSSFEISAPSFKHPVTTWRYNSKL